MMKKFLFVLAMVLIAAVFFPMIASAQGPTDPCAPNAKGDAVDPMHCSIQQQPELRCFAKDLHVSNEQMALFKFQTDHQFGLDNKVETLDQWRATVWNRWQYLADATGTQNHVVLLKNFVDMVRDAACQRLIDAQLKIEATPPITAGP